MAFYRRQGRRRIQKLEFPILQLFQFARRSELDLQTTGIRYGAEDQTYTLAFYSKFYFIHLRIACPFSSNKKKKTYLIDVNPKQLGNTSSFVALVTFLSQMSHGPCTTFRSWVRKGQRQPFSSASCNRNAPLNWQVDRAVWDKEIFRI